MPVNESLSIPEPEKKWRLGFWSLIATQFQGAFNENGLKFLVIYLILAVEKDKAQRDQFELLVGILFAAPFILFSLTGGYLADRFSKRAVTIWTKVFEVGVMLFAVVALVEPNLKLALAAIFLVCTQGALFGPSKYGLLPELLPQERLSWGNGVLELGTFLAIIVGSVSGSFLAEAFDGRQIYSGALLLGFTIAGLAWSFGISRVPAADPRKRFHLTSLVDVGSPMTLIRRDRVLWLAVVGNTYFFFVAGLLRRIFHRADQRPDPAPAGGRPEGRGHRRSELAFFCGHWRRFRCVLRCHSFSAPQPGRNFLLVGACHTRSNSLCVAAAAGFVVAAFSVDCHQHALPLGRRRAGKRAHAWRRVADSQPCLHGRCGTAHRIARSSDPVSDVQGFLRASAGQTIRKNHGGDSHRVGPRAARNDPFFAAGHRRTEKRRNRLHFPGRADDADRPDAALPPRHGAHHQRRRRSHHSRESGRRVGLDLQFCRRAISLEISAADSLPRASHLWKAGASDGLFPRSPPRRDPAPRGGLPAKRPNLGWFSALV